MITSALLPAPGRVTPPDTAALRCRDRLARRVAARVGPDGLLQAPCESRVLESALALRLLTAEQADPDTCERLTRYLKTTLDTGPPDAVQTALARAALGETVPGDTSAERALASIDHFTAARKRLMFQTLLAELGAADHPRCSPDAFDARGQQSWLHLEMTAVKVIAAHGSGNPGALTAQDWAALMPAVRPGPAWECNNLARLVGLLALRRNPAHRPAVRRTLPYVTAGLRPDGGLAFISGMDVFATATAGLALAGAGQRTPLLGLMAEAVGAQQNPDGGFGFHPGVSQSDVDDTSYGIEFLRATAPDRHRRTIASAEHYLLAQRNPDGGFPTFARGTRSEIAMTAAAVNALAPDPGHRSVVDEGVRFILRHQQPDGTFERSWSRNATNAVFRAVLACDAGRSGALAAERAAAKQRAGRHLAEVQNADGGWGHRPGDPSDPISTAYAVIALSRSPARGGALRRAVDHLVDCQRPDGGYLSRPDQAGPRPLLYDVPALADIFVLLGLAHATAAGSAPTRKG
ncbi:hypothetical protein GCM10010193_64210 [Kitasatospora atroaurantiaca]|uniref:Squalene-hopene/tetraprenyl-beta-curcumene cyclase/sporulenol synthase n=1 Tax=Kitasatospora atroaurantiaca TaxID=285545 RepID=A0A561F1N3_9ACTN|nr:prenyltransferase/squalene oxidase repeat-containing protein [Kitasatospora atroaurantiaca]TWE21761.1 squalene-hopene/tetraprenyl-beta-curcumene cyclase/sporulenol synthase [Kitasatospora atroaurantiaca]